MKNWRFLLASVLLFIVVGDTRTYSSRVLGSTMDGWECPDGFYALTKHGPRLHNTSAWGCYKLSQERATLQEADQYCKSISYHGSLIGSILASDKNEESHEILVNLANSTSVYIGVLISLSITNGENKVFKHSFDNTPVGDTDIDGQIWHGIYSDLGAGWLNDDGVAMRLQHSSEKCLSILYPSSDIYLPLCSGPTVSRWRFAFNMLMDTNPSDRSVSFQCLTVDAPVYSLTIYNKFGLGASNLSNLQIAKNVVGKRCDLKDPNQKWIMKNNSIVSMTSGMVLSTNDKFVTVQDPHIMEWFANARYSGKKRLEVMLDESTIWYQLRAKDSDNCFGVFEEQQSGRVAPILHPCAKDKHSQHWTELWSDSHLMNRKYLKCLSVNSTETSGATKFADIAVVYLEDCVLEKPEQMFHRTRHKSDTRNKTRGDKTYYYKYALAKANYFLSHTSCQPSFLAFDMKGVCAHDLEVDDKLLLLPNKKLVSVKREVFEIVNQAVPYLCLRVRKSSITDCGGSIIYVGRCEQSLAPGSWWVWTSKGTMLMSVDMGDLMCCMTLTESGKFVLQACRHGQINQMFKLEQGQTGTRIIGIDRTVVLTADHVSIIKNESTANLVAKWNVLSNQNGRGVLDTLTDCRPQRPADRIKYEGTRSFTSQGMECQSWRSQWPREHVFQMKIGPLCRKPESWRLTDSQPWCIVRNSSSSLMVGECTLPNCAEHLGVYLSPNGSWVITGGLERKRFVCEAPVKHAQSCVDAPSLYKGNIAAVKSDKIGFGYLSGATVNYSCSENHVRSSTLVNQDLICANGTWMGKVPTCNPARCKVHDDDGFMGIKNANPTTHASHASVGATVEYKCHRGTYIDLAGDFTDTIRLRCDGRHVWSTVPTSELYVSVKNISDLSKLSCQPSSCYNEPQFTAIGIGQWCIAMSNNTELKCPSGYRRGLPPEVASNSDFQSMFHSLRFNKTYLGAAYRVENGTRRSTTHAIVFRSELTGDALVPYSHYNPAHFHISAGTWKYCLGISSNDDLIVSSCQGEEVNEAFLFRWYRMKHIMNIKTGKCLEGNNAVIEERLRLRDCEIDSHLQKWSCTGDVLEYTFGVDQITLAFTADIIKKIPVTLKDVPSNYHKLFRGKPSEVLSADICNIVPGINRCVMYRKTENIEFSMSEIYESGCSDNDVTLMCVKPLPAMCEDPPTNITNAKRDQHYSKEDVRLPHYQFKVKKGSAVILYEFGREITYSCGYGSRTNAGGRKLKITCRIDGKWFPESPGCSRFFCSKPVDSPHAYPIMFSNDTVRIPLKTEITVRCIPGFEISTRVLSQISMCTPVGWSPPIAWCRISSCPRPVLGSDMVYVGNTHRIGNIITVRCRYGSAISSGRTVFNASVHICNKNGAWVPSLTNLKCLPYYCPPPIVNVVEFHGFGRNQRLVIECEKDETLLNGTGAVPAGSVTVYCGELKNWVPDVSHLRCSRNVCPIPVSRSMNLVKLGLEEEYNKDHTFAKITCPTHQHTTPFFKIIFRGSAAETICLEGDVTHEVVIASNNKRCDDADNLGMYWRFHPENLNLLQNLANQKCLTAANNLSQVLRSTRIGLKDCVTSGQADNQKWDCYNLQNGRFLGLSQEKIADNLNVMNDAIMSIRMEDMHLVLDSFSNTQVSYRAWPDVSSICQHKRYISSIELSCSSSGEWSPSPLGSVICVQSTCPPPINTSGLIFFGATNSNGDPIPYDRWRIPSSYHTSFKVKCLIDSSSRNSLPPTILCKTNGIWDPPLQSLECKQSRCSDLTSYGDIVVVEDSFYYKRTRSFATIRCSPGKWFKNRKLEQRVICMSNGEWMPPVNNKLCIPLLCSEEFNDPNLGKIEKHAHASFTLTCKSDFWFGYGIWKLDVQCSTNGEWVPSYSCIPVYCKRPPYIRFARLSLPNNNKLWRIGAKLNYQCMGSYVFSNNQNSQIVVTCASHGLWKPNPVFITCQPSLCSSRSEIIKLNPYARIKGVSSLPGSKMEISCLTSFKMLYGATSMNITCSRDGSWYPPLSSTICNKIRCIRGPPLKNGMVAVSGEYDSELSFSCEAGYKFVGSSPVYCSDDGKWVPSLDGNKCFPTSCTKPRNTSTAIQFHFKTPRDTALVGDRIRITCAEGYRFEDGIKELHLECTANGDFYPRPVDIVCKLIFCTDPFNITNMEISSNYIRGAGGWPMGASVAYKCSPLFQSATRQESIQCQGDGGWSRTPNLFSPCRLVTCPYIAVQNAKVVEFINDENGIHSFGSVLRFGCIDGFWFDKSLHMFREVRCSENGSWTPDLSQIACVPISCGKLSSALIEGKGDRKYLSKLAIYCQANSRGGSACGTNNYLCLEFCKPPPAVNGATLIGSTPTILGGTAEYICDDGKSKDVGEKSFTLKCTRSGLWKPRDLQCVTDSDFTCRAPYQGNGLISELPSRYLVNEKVKYTCANGYSFDGRNEEHVVVSCQSNGKWIPDPRQLYCIRIACDNPTLKTKIMSSSSSSIIADVNTIDLQNKSDKLLFFRTLIEFSCKKGYWMWSSHTPTITSTCMKNNKFHPHPASIVCKPQPCANLPNIPSSSMQSYAGPNGSPRTRVVCDNGYKRKNTLNSNSFEIICSNRTWSYDDTDFCDVIECGVPPQISFATRRFFNTQYQSVATYKCLPGFWLSFKFVSSMEVKCMDNGKWHPDPLSQIHCTNVDCSEPPETISATLSFDLTTYGSKAIYRCKDGNKFDHPSATEQTVTQCQVNGLWSPGPESIARCISKSCHGQTIPAYRYVKRQYGDLFYGDTWNYECADGFYSGHHKTSFSITCLADGTFSRPTGSCFASYCGPPPRIHNAVVLENKQNSGIQIVRYRCRSGMWISKGMSKKLEANLTCRGRIWVPNYHTIRCIPLICDVFDTPISTFEKGAKITRSHPRELPMFNSTVTYECPSGQFVAAYSKRVVIARCSPDGRWTHDPDRIKCEPTKCPTTNPDANALWTPRSNRIGDVAKLTCLRPFIITRNKTWITRVCSEDGTWIPPAPCVPNHCPPPPTNTALRIVSTESSSTGIAYPSGSTIQIFCTLGYTSSDQPFTSKCRDDGEWESDISLVVCSPIQCPPLIMEGGNSHVKGHMSLTFNSTVNFQCNVGFMVKAGLLNTSTRCREDGTWSNQIEKLRCVSVRCSFSRLPDGGYIVAKGNSGPLYEYQQTITITCNSGGHTFSNGMSTINSICSINGLLIPRISDARCLPPMCDVPQEKNYADISYTSLTPGSSLTVKCDPLRWIGNRLEGNQTLITTDFNITTQCLGSSLNWDLNLDNIECVDITEQNDVINPQSPNEEIYTVQLLPVTSIDHLRTQDDNYVLNSDSQLHAIKHWMMRSLKSTNHQIAKRSSISQRYIKHLELSRALTNKHYSLLARMILGGLLRRIDCSELLVFVKDDSGRLQKVYYSEFSDPYLAELFQLTPQYLSYVDTKQKCEDYKYYGVTASSISTEFLLERLHFISDHFNITLSETLLAPESVFNKEYDNVIKAKGRRVSTSYISSSDVYAVFDGDHNSAWSPTTHGGHWLLEIHLKEHHLIKEIWMKVKISNYFNITFAPNDASYPVRTFGPITLDAENEINGTTIEVVDSNSGVSDTEKTVTITWEEMQPAAIIRFTFAFSSPVVYEARILAQRVQWMIVYPLDRAFYLMMFILIFSLLILPIALLVDHKRLKDEIIHWIGKNPNEGIPCLIKIRVGEYPRLPMNVLMRIVCEGEEIAARTLVKTRCPRTSLRRKHLLIGVSLCKEPNEEFLVEFASIPDGNDKEIDYYLSFPPVLYKWDILNLEAMLEGKVWKTQMPNLPFPLMFNQRSTFKLCKDINNEPQECNICKNANFIQKFIFSASHPRYHEYTYTYLTCVQRFLILLSSISTAIFIGVCMHILLLPRIDADQTRTQDRDSNIPALSFLIVLLATLICAFLILFWRGVFVRCNESVLQSRAQQRSPITQERPHPKLVDILSPSKDVGGKEGSSFMPLYNDMINWITERNGENLEKDTSEVRILLPSGRPTTQAKLGNVNNYDMQSGNDENFTPFSLRNCSSDNGEQLQERTEDVPSTYVVVEEGFMMQFQSKNSRAIFGLYLCLLLYSILMYLANYSILDANRYGHQADSLIRTTIYLFVTGLFVAPLIEIFFIRIFIRYGHVKPNDYKIMVDDFYRKYNEKKQALEKKEESDSSTSALEPAATILHHKNPGSQLITNTKETLPMKIWTASTGRNVDQTVAMENDDGDYFTDYSGLLLKNDDREDSPPPGGDNDDPGRANYRPGTPPLSPLYSDTETMTSNSTPSYIAPQQAFSSSSSKCLTQDIRDYYKTAHVVPELHTNQHNDEMDDQSAVIHHENVRTVTPSVVQLVDDYTDDNIYEEESDTNPSDDCSDVDVNQTFTVDNDISLLQPSSGENKPVVSTCKMLPSLLELNRSTYNVMNSTFVISPTKSLIPYEDEDNCVEDCSNTFVCSDYSITNMLTRTIRTQSGKEQPCCSKNIESPPDEGILVPSLLVQSKSIKTSTNCEDFPAVDVSVPTNSLPRHIGDDDDVSSPFHSPREYFFSVGNEVENLSSDDLPSASGHLSLPGHLDFYMNPPPKKSHERVIHTETRRLLNIIKEIPEHEIPSHFQSSGKRIYPQRRFVPCPSAGKAPSSSTSRESFVPLSVTSSSSFKSLDNDDEDEFVPTSKEHDDLSPVESSPKPILTSVVDYLKSWKSHFVGHEDQQLSRPVKLATTVKSSVINETMELKFVAPSSGGTQGIFSHQSDTKGEDVASSSKFAD